MLNYKKRISNDNGETNKQYKVGIVIPAYNVESYIDKCIESVMEQTYENIVIAIVNDGSQDDTWNHILKYMKEFPTIIRSVDSENNGVMRARLTGIRLLYDCDYILFVDADDYLMDKDIIKICVEYMKDADMVCFNTEQNGKAYFKNKKKLQLTSKEGIKNILSRQYLDGNLTAGCYKYKYVKENFKIMECNNDDYINKAAFINACEKITVIPNIGYFYRVNAYSQTHKPMKEKDYLFYLHVQDFCRQVLVQYPEYKKEAEYFESWVLLWLVTGLNKHKEMKNLNIYNISMEEFKKHKACYIKNNYFSIKDKITFLCLEAHVFGFIYNQIYKLRRLNI